MNNASRITNIKTKFGWKLNEKNFIFHIVNGTTPMGIFFGGNSDIIQGETYLGPILCTQSKLLVFQIVINY